MIICPVCETENEIGSVSCILCGSPLDQVAPPAPSQPRMPSTPATPTPTASSPSHNSPSPPTAPPSTAKPTPTPKSSPQSSAPTKGSPSVEIPSPGTLCLIVYYQRRPSLYYSVVYDEILIGRQDPASNSFPDLDLTPFDPDLAISRKHCYLYREDGRYYIYPISNSGTQVNQEMVDIGSKRRLQEGDVIILSGRLAIRFAKTV